MDEKYNLVISKIIKEADNPGDPLILEKAIQKEIVKEQEINYLIEYKKKNITNREIVLMPAQIVPK